ncbi:hypothetical protein [Kitasatospora phosalacinea]|uniref:Uncharacterized protein n=1 Tax=Kitasatospora phosalacinea TaxID=2065 RepID=A0A9W6ULM0_9ACTN|nr:hypothetical protein [Kitasatospora phosalacinea]GLW52724.1 hypothetical protein Kpho01_07350 [Kitasatospora phosalacinea]
MSARPDHDDAHDDIWAPGPGPGEEEALLRAFRETGGQFLADTPRLVEAGAVRGRRRRRGQLSALAGAAALVLAVGALTAVARPDGHPALAVGPAAPGASRVPPPAGASDASGGTAADAALPEELHTVSVLGRLLPPGVRIVRSSGSTHGPGTVPNSEATAYLLVDNGHGRSKLSVSVGNAGWEKALGGCPTGQVVGWACHEVPDAVGGRMFVSTWGPAPSAASGGPVSHDVRLEDPDGLRVVLHSSQEEWTDGGPASGADALLTVDQLTAIAADPAWRSVLGTLTRVPKDTRPTPEVRLPDLVPTGLNVKTFSGTWSQQYATLADGTREVDLTVQVAQADRVTRSWFARAPVLADGSRVRTAADRPVPYAQGATETVVAVLRPDGLLLRVTALDPAGAGVLLTREQVEAVALSPSWSALDAHSPTK